MTSKLDIARAAGLADKHLGGCAKDEGQGCGSHLRLWRVEGKRSRFARYSTLCDTTAKDGAQILVNSFRACELLVKHAFDGAFAIN